MDFYYLRSIIVWGCWLIFADKKRWRELFTVGFFATFLDGFADILSFHYPLWKYQPSNSVIPDLFDNLGVYVVVPYLFIQWLPQSSTLPKLLLYWVAWTSVAIVIEWIHVYTGYMTYGRLWNMGYSYIVDWIIYWLIYQFHKHFHLKKLSR